MKQSLRLEKLEAVRGLAAFYVLVHHYVHCRNELAALHRFFVFGQFAVLVFFVLSGFVIYYSLMARKPEMSFRDFFVARFRRIYPIFILALLTNWLLRCFVLGEWSDFYWQDFLGNIFQFQDDNHPWVLVHPYLQNHPLWSLAYEWWFYMLFFALHKLCFHRPDLQKWIVFGFCGVNVILFTFFPNPFTMYAAYWIMWWCGVELAREYLETGRVTLQRQALPWGMTLIVGLLWLLPTQFGPVAGQALDMAVYPFLQMRHFATLGTVLVGAFIWYKLRFAGFRYLIRPFGFFAPISYALYIVHLPFLHTSAPKGTGNVWLDGLIFIPIILGYAWLLEQPFQKWVNRWLR